VVVQLQDAFGNAVAQSATAITLALNGGSGLTGTIPQSTNGSGMAAFNDLAISAANINLTFTATAGSLTPATSTDFSIAANAFAPTTLAVTSVNGGSNPVAGTPFSVLVESHDIGGNPCSVSADTAFSLSITTGTGTLTGTLTGTITSGTSSLMVSGVVDTKAEGGVVITAQRSSGDVLGNGSSSAFAVIPADASHLVVSGLPSAQGVGVAGSLTVVVKDAYSNTVTGYTGTISFSSSDSLAVFPSPYAFVSGNNGVHTFTNGVTLNTVGVQSITATDTVTASVTGTQSGITVYIVPTAFNWTNTAGGNWSVAANWSNASGQVLAPITAGQSNYVLNFNQAGTYTATSDLSTVFQLNQLHFGGPTVTLAGNRMVLTTDNTPVPAVTPSINQTSSAAVVVGNDLVLGDNTAVNGTGSGQVDLGGVISGTGSLTKSTPGVLKIYGLVPNTYSGGTVINSGTLWVGTMVGGNSPAVTSVLGTGPVTLASGTTIEFDNVTATNTLISNGGKLASINGWGFKWNGAVTLNANTTIDTTNGNAGNLSFGVAISGSGGLIITGHGTVTLSGTNTYTGNTTVNGGILSINSAYLADNSTVTIATGAKLDLNTAGASDTIAALVLGGVTVPAGTYNSTTPTYGTYFTGTGSLVVGSSYTAWASKFPTADLSNPAADYDGDGMTNFQEYAFGLDPTLSTSANPITSPLTTAGMFAYTRRNPALTLLNYTVWTTTDLQNWTLDATASQTPNSPSAETQTVTVTLTNTSPAPGGKLFVRVQAAP